MPRHELTPEDREKGGKNGKRGASIKNQIEKILSGDIPPIVMRVLRERKILVGDKLVSDPKLPMDRHAAKAVALVLLKNALLDEAWAVKILAEYMDGKPASNDTLTLLTQTPEEKAIADAEAKAVLEKYALPSRSNTIETTAVKVEE